MNTKRIVIGGLVAGVAMNAVSFVANNVILMDKYAAATARGAFLKEPRFFFFPFILGALFLGGLALAWLYAAARARLGPGPKTALLVGLAVAVVAAIPANVALAAWATYGRFIPFVWACETGAYCVIGALVAGALYKE